MVVCEYFEDTRDAPINNKIDAESRFAGQRSIWAVDEVLESLLRSTWRILNMIDDDRLIYQIFMAQQKLQGSINNTLITQGIKVTLGQAGLLFLLQRDDGQTMTELSKALAVKNATLTGLIDRLERSAFVIRKASQKDRRSIRIYITSAGIEECDKAKPVIKRVNEEIKSGFSQEEIEVFKRVLHSVFQKFKP
jgi:DNA-binding MarR family transcriptional regulator